MQTRAGTRIRTESSLAPDVASPVYQAYLALRSAFVIAPILFGADKFFNAMTNWEQYLAPAIPNAIGVSPELFMRGVGVIEIVAGLLVAIVPRYAAYVVMVWLWAIIGNLAMTGKFWDIALRDFGLSVGAFALARLAWAAHHWRETHS